ncbi:MAG: endolytic transglycosylase MltG [Gemmatimonadota bacterium]|nr:endolytic transglycosylase MltG [Gemmatimonadota bacterium]
MTRTAFSGRSRRALLSGLSVLCVASCRPSERAARVILPAGASFSAVTDSLKAHGVITHPASFKLLARLRGVDRSVHSGVYEFPAGVSPVKVLTMLARGQKAALRFTVPEGLTIPEVAALAREKLGIPPDSFVAAARDSAAATALLGMRTPSFEGFLRPETYLLPADINARELVRLMAQGFKAEWTPAWDARLDTLKMSRLAMVTLASIVEGEARADEERETIAGVYHNRLRIGMPLQADPTVQYAILLKRGKRKPRLFVKDYQIASPYNTYLNRGLPPAPVNSPSRRSIEATLYPADVRYLYFVAGTDGRHVFSRTYNEHLRAIRQIRRGERTAGQRDGGTARP